MQSILSTLANRENQEKFWKPRGSEILLTPFQLSRIRARVFWIQEEEISMVSKARMGWRSEIVLLRYVVAAGIMAGLLARGVQAQEMLRVGLPSGEFTDVPMVVVDDIPYLAMSDVSELLRSTGRGYLLEWDSSLGTLRILDGETSYSLFLDRSALLGRGSIVECKYPLRILQGQVLIPVDSFILLTKYLGEFNVELPGGLPEAIASPAVPEGPFAEPEVRPQETPEEDLITRLAHVELPPYLPVQSGEALQSIAKTERVVPFRHLVIDPDNGPLRFPELKDPDYPNQLTLDIAEKCEAILVREASIQTTVVHPDRKASLEDRIDQINTSGANVLLCLRIGASEFRDVAGLQVYCINEAIDWQGQQYSEGFEEPALLPLGLQYLPYQYQSLMLANYIKRELAKSVASSVWEIKVAPLVVLKRAAMCSVLVEVGYLTNPRDAKRLAEEGQRELIARALAGAMLSYRRYLEAVEKLAP
jgi:N-acetylmuramoyl-L-alanine amidase